MPPTNAPLFTLLSARLGWLSQRQAILGQNLANAETPDYRPRDLRPADFARLIRPVPEPAGRVALAAPIPAISTRGEAPASASAPVPPTAATRPRPTATP